MKPKNNAEEYATRNAEKPEDVFKLHHAYNAGFEDGRGNQMTGFILMIWSILIAVGMIAGHLLTMKLIKP